MQIINVNESYKQSFLWKRFCKAPRNRSTWTSPQSCTI